MIGGNEIITISPNIVYQDSTGVVPTQSNPVYITTNDIHTYEELPYSRLNAGTEYHHPHLPTDNIIL